MIQRWYMRKRLHSCEWPCTGSYSCHGIFKEKAIESNIFNLGNGVGFTVKEVVETARKVTGHPIPGKGRT